MEPHRIMYSLSVSPFSYGELVEGLEAIPSYLGVTKHILHQRWSQLPTSIASNHESTGFSMVFHNQIGEFITFHHAMDLPFQPQGTTCSGRCRVCPASRCKGSKGDDLPLTKGDSLGSWQVRHFSKDSKVLASSHP